MWRPDSSCHWRLRPSTQRTNLDWSDPPQPESEGQQVSRTSANRDIILSKLRQTEWVKKIKQRLYFLKWVWNYKINSKFWAGKYLYESTNFGLDSYWFEKLFHHFATEKWKRVFHHFTITKGKRTFHHFTIAKWKRVFHHFTTVKWKRAFHHFSIVKWKRAFHHFTTAKWKIAFHHFTTEKWKR